MMVSSSSGLQLLCVIILCLLTSCHVSAQEQRDSSSQYEGYKVLEVTASTVKHLEYLHRLQREDAEIDLWTEPVGVGEPVQVMVSADHHPIVSRRLTEQNIPHHVTNINVQELVKRSMPKKRALDDEIDLDDFNDLNQTYRFLDEVVAKCSESAWIVCEVYSMGNTYEGRPIKVLKISRPHRMPYSFQARKGVWIDSGIHAREWLSVATSLKIINHLVTTDDFYTRLLLKRYDWYIIPVLNPDGYAYSHSTERLWRKNRRPNEGNRCVGTDLNRNFDSHWGTYRISFDPCNPVYCGREAASEPETVAIQAEMRRLGSSMAAMLSLHCYGQYWMFPYGHKDERTGRCARADNHYDMMEVANAAADAVEATNWLSTWKRGTTCEAIYENSGGTIDYAHAKANFSYPYVAELRGASFVVTPDQIDPSYREMWNGIKTMLKVIYEKNHP